MNNRIEEPLSPHFGFYYTKEEALYHEKTPFQTLDIVSTKEFGRVLLLDGCTQVAEKKHFQYHELIADAALLTHPAPENVLIIGGGDGGTTFHVLQHPSVKKVVQVELDEAVSRVAQKYLPSVSAGGFDDPRVTLLFADGKKYIEKYEKLWDVIIMDLTDPVGQVADLYRESFWQLIKTRLRSPFGAFSLHSSSPFFDEKLFATIHQRIRSVFPDVLTFYNYIQMYGTLWSVSTAGNSKHMALLSEDIIAQRIAERSLQGQLQLINAQTFFSLQKPFPYIETLLKKY